MIIDHFKWNEGKYGPRLKPGNKVRLLYVENTYLGNVARFTSPVEVGKTRLLSFDKEYPVSFYLQNPMYSGDESKKLCAQMRGLDHVFSGHKELFSFSNNFPIILDTDKTKERCVYLCNNSLVIWDCPAFSNIEAFVEIHNQQWLRNTEAARIWSNVYPEKPWYSVNVSAQMLELFRTLERINGDMEVTKQAIYGAISRAQRCGNFSTIN